MNAQAKTINLLLYDGDLDGVISIEDSSWNSGELYSAPRSSVDDLLTTDACKKYGVYLLLSSDTVYVGQSSDLAKRITQHKVGKDWWQSVVILTTKDDSLNHSDIDYLESVLIGKAQTTNKLDCDNKNKGNPPKVDKFRKVYLGQYLDEALFLLKLIGVTVFSESASKSKKSTSPGMPHIVSNDLKTKLALGKRVKAEAIQFVNSKGFSLKSDVSYAVLQGSGDHYWANPRVDLLQKEWWVILNNNKEMLITLLRIPAGTLSLKNGSGTGLFVRGDKLELIDLNLVTDTLVDKKSGIDFSPFVVKKISYKG